MDIAEFILDIEVIDLFFIFLVTWALGMAHLLGKVKKVK